MSKDLAERQRLMIESMYTEDGVSMKNIALYFQQIGKPIDEAVISRHLKRNGLSRKKGGTLNNQALPSFETVYSMALRLMHSRVCI